MRQNPRDWHIDDLETIAAAYGIAVRKSGGSHVVFEHAASPMALSVPAKRKIKPIYVRRFTELLDTVIEQDKAKQ